MNEAVKNTPRTTLKQFANQSVASAIEQGKLQPQALDLEGAVLGAMLLDKEPVNTVIEILRPESFYKEAHQRIYAAIADLFGRSEPIDILTVTNELRKKGELEIVGGAYYISELTNRVASTAHIEAHARIISQKHIQRELIKVSSKIIENAYDETIDVLDLLDDAESGLFSIAEGNIRRNYEKMSQLINKAIQQIESAKAQEGNLIGIPSGFTELDRITSGWQPSDLVIIAGRPAMGKTAFVLSLARNVAVDYNQPIAVFSLEMSSLQLVTRLISSEAELSSEKIRSGRLANHEMEQIHAKIKGLADAPIYIDDTPALSIFELRAKARRLKQKHDIKLLVVDYLQLMTTGGDKARGNREQEISTISRSLKSIAKELNIPIIALSQLSRAVETRGSDRRPQLSDLRESGAIEQDADMVIFLHRPEYYKIYEDEKGNSTQGIANIIIAKHRNGSVGDVQLKFQSHLAKFSDLEENAFGDSEGFSKLSPNENFDSSPTITRGSKMNKADDFNNSDGNDQVPF